MSIEQNLERIATALEKIATNGGSIAVNYAAVGQVSTAEVKVTAMAPDPKIAAKVKADADAKVKADADAKVKADADAKAKADADAKAKADADADAALSGGTVSVKSATIDDVRKALQSYRQIEGTPAMLEILKSFGAANINEIKPEQYADVVAKAS